MTTYQEEKISELWDEIMPLLEQHFWEISANHDIPLNPNVQAYNQMEANGNFKIYTARDNGELVGYAAYFLAPNMHYMDSFQAQQDVLFLKADRRKGMTGIRLIKYADKMLAEHGCQMVCHHVKVKNDFGLILKRLGYNLVETIWSKRLDK